MTSIEFSPPINNHLRRIDSVLMKGIRVCALSLAESRRRVRVCPAQVVPVINVLAEDYNLRASHGLLFLKPRQNLVGWRTTRTTFGSKEFDEDRSTLAFDFYSRSRFIFDRFRGRRLSPGNEQRGSQRADNSEYHKIPTPHLQTPHPVSYALSSSFLIYDSCEVNGF